MFRHLIVCLLGLSGVFFETYGIKASPVETPLMDTTSMTKDADGMTSKSKRYNIHPGPPCPLSYPNSGAYIPPTSLSHQKPLAIQSYHQMPKVELIGYQKPVIPKIIYQTIQKPAIHHAAYNVQPMVKQQVQYIQQPTYMPTVKEQPISHVKSVASTVSYEHVPKFITSYAKPMQHIQPVQIFQPAIKTYVKQIPCENGPAPAPVVEKSVEKPMIQMVQPYYAKQFLQPISYYPKPLSQPKPISISSGYVNKYHYSQPASANLLYQKPNLISQSQSIIKVPSAAGQPDCEKIHQPDISYVKTPEPVLQKVNQPMLQYAPKYHQSVVQEPIVHFTQKVHQPIFHFTPKIHQPAIVQQPLVHFSPKIHQPIAHNSGFQYVQPIVYGNAEHSVPVNQPCHK